MHFFFKSLLESISKTISEASRKHHANLHMKSHANPQTLIRKDDRKQTQNVAKNTIKPCNAFIDKMLDAGFWILDKTWNTFFMYQELKHQASIIQYQLVKW